MTSPPDLLAQIKAVREIISRNGTVKFIWPRDVQVYSAILGTLQQHERLEAVVEIARELVKSAGAIRPAIDSAIVGATPLLFLKSALAALDTATSITKEQHT